MKTEIMSGSSCLECLFFMSCRSWQKASRFWGQGQGETQQPVRGSMHSPVRYPEFFPPHTHYENTSNCFLNTDQRRVFEFNLGLPIVNTCRTKNNRPLPHIPVGDILWRLQ